MLYAISLIQKYPSFPFWQKARQCWPWHLTPWHDSCLTRVESCQSDSKLRLPVADIYPSNCVVSKKGWSVGGIGGISIFKQQRGTPCSMPTSSQTSDQNVHRRQNAVVFTDLTFFLLQIFLNPDHQLWLVTWSGYVDWGQWDPPFRVIWMANMVFDHEILGYPIFT